MKITIQTRKSAIQAFIDTIFQKIAMHLKLAICLLLFYGTHQGIAQPAKLFQSDDILEITLKCDMKALQRDRNTEKSTFMDASVVYQENGVESQVPIRIRTRGRFRRKSSNCQYPPLLLNFSKNTTPEGSLFEGQDRIKLVTSCRGDDFVVNEYLVYRLYNLITPKSFRARLVRMVYQDQVTNSRNGPYYGILLEEDDQMAERNNCHIMKDLQIRPGMTQRDDFLKMAVFQYMIGNTDWSIQFLQNIRLMRPDSTTLPTTVPYDFDHAGIVRAPYARPAPELKMSSTRERRYRGFCIQDMEEYTGTFAFFNQLKEDFYAVYRENTLISDKYRQQTLVFLDKFYETINNPGRASREFLYPCDPSGTGNVVIKGLRE